MVKLGLSEVIGSWKIMAIRLPLRSRMTLSGTSQSSRPSKRIEPEIVAVSIGNRRMMASADTLLPEPDSPTTPSVAPRRRVKLFPATASVIRARSSANVTRRSETSSSGLTAAAVIVYS